MMLRDGRLKALNIFLQVGLPHKPDLADAGLPLERLLSGEYTHAGAKLRIVLKIRSDLPGTVAVEPRQPILYICRVCDLGRLAVADNIDAGLHLPPNIVGDRL